MMKPPTPSPDKPEHLVPIQLRKDLLAEGHSDRSIGALIRDGAIRRIRHGSYVSPQVWDQLDARARHVVLTRAVMLRAKAEVVASHRSALAIWEGPMWDLTLDTVETTRRDGKAGRREAGVRAHVGALRAQDVTLCHGIATTALPRTILDNVASLDSEHGLVIVNHFLHEGAVSDDELLSCELFMRQWPETLGTQHVLRLSDGRIESVGESRSYYLCWSQGLPMPQPQYEVFDPGGQVVARLDFAWPRHKVWLEFDGKEKYVKFLREGESVVDAVLREKRREKLIEDLTGWRCIRITWADLYQPTATAARIRSLLSWSTAAA